ncbi:MAG: hypothetical protein WCK96_19455 [Methylococcales bacterium]
MAMTKKEKEAFDEAILRAETLAALRWTTLINPDIPIPKKDKTTGWLYDVYSKKVYEAWSRSNEHGAMPYYPDNGTKRGAALYSTKSLALAAMRCAIEMQSAQELLDVDKLIEGHKKTQVFFNDKLVPLSDIGLAPEQWSALSYDEQKKILSFYC